MTAEICGSATLCSLEFDLIGEFEYDYVDDSFDHEFGTERCGHFEVTNVLWAEFDGDEIAVCYDDLKRQVVEGRSLSRKRFRHALRQLVRQVRQALDNADPNTLFNEDRMTDVAAEAGSD